MPILVGGKPLTEMPVDLFIPPDALQVLLDEFCGPLDLLLYLIRKQNFDILDIPVALITRQYMDYIQMMEARRLELAAEYLLMAAMLIDIKTRLLLPLRKEAGLDIEEDPRLALVNKLKAYEQYKLAAENLNNLPRDFRDTFPVKVQSQGLETLILHPDVPFDELLQAMHSVLQRQQHEARYQIIKESLSVRERMSYILEQLTSGKSLSFESLLKKSEGRLGLVVTFLAILELARESLIMIFQETKSSIIYLQALVHE